MLLMMTHVPPYDSGLDTAPLLSPDLRPQVTAGDRMDPGLVERKITSRTRAIVAVHTYGHPVDIDPLRSLAADHHLYLVEDAAEPDFSYRAVLDHCGKWLTETRFRAEESVFQGRYDRPKVSRHGAESAADSQVESL